MILLQDITKIYHTEGMETRALDGLNLQISDGEMVAVMGPSGSGKSTLLNIIGLMDQATEGTYRYQNGEADIEVTGLKRGEAEQFRKAHIGFVFQNFALLNDYTVYENVEIPLRARNISPKERKKRVEEALDKLGIGDLAPKRPAQISGGQQQRVAIARTLVTNADVILADEPTGALDKKNGEEIMHIFREMKKENRIILVVTHDSHIAEYCDRVIYLEDGKIL